MVQNLSLRFRLVRDIRIQTKSTFKQWGLYSGSSWPSFQSGQFLRRQYAHEGFRARLKIVDVTDGDVHIVKATLVVYY